MLKAAPKSAAFDLHYLYEYLPQETHQFLMYSLAACGTYGAARIIGNRISVPVADDAARFFKDDRPRSIVPGL